MPIQRSSSLMTSLPPPYLLIYSFYTLAQALKCSSFEVSSFKFQVSVSKFSFSFTFGATNRVFAAVYCTLNRAWAPRGTEGQRAVTV